MATIGALCLQQSLLEYNLARIIWELLDFDPDTGAIVTGGLDLRPRLNMAILLARHKKAPRQVCNALVKLRDELRETELLERRNRAVHGVHVLIDEGRSTRTRMLRVAKPNRDQILTTEQLVSDIQAMCALAFVAKDIVEKIAASKLRKRHRNEDVSGNL